ncbi:MAG: RND transporter [Thermodesulfobacteriota bacterium]
MVRELIARLDWPLLVVLFLTIGLAPFTPPHLVEKIRMLSQGTLEKPVDWFDLIFHASPWLFLAIKAAYAVLERYFPK